MPLLLIDGPEAAGKTTLISSVVDLWYGHGRTTSVRKWGPVDSWREYVDPLTDDVNASHASEHLVVWDRGWPSEVVYNEALNRGRTIRYRDLFPLERMAAGASALRIILTSDVPTLVQRRHERVNLDAKADLPVSPTIEHSLYRAYGVDWGWQVVPTISPKTVVGRLFTTAALSRLQSRKGAIMNE